MNKIILQPIGKVQSPRKETIDDQWGDVISTIHLDPQQFTEEAIAGLDDFSHLEIVFYMHLVPQHKIQKTARHPRNRKDWPRVGIFAQRAKSRPNLIGVSRCRLLRVEGMVLTVQALDAVDGTPVLDIKPYMKEFGPKGDIKQPDWATEVMKEYYSKGQQQ